VFGVVFQHGIALEPWAWLELLADALEAADDAAAATAYRELATPLARSTRVLDAQGRPVPPGERFVLRVVDAGGNVVTDTSLTSGADGDLGMAPVAAGHTATLRWDPPGDTLPLLAHYEGALRTGEIEAVRALPDDGALALPAGFAGGHLQVLDLAAWLADPPPHGRDLPWPRRFRPGSHLLPLVDGVETFRLLVPDLRACQFGIRRDGDVDRGGTHMLGGWAFNDFEMVPGDASSTLTELVKLIRSPRNGDPVLAGDARLLAAQFVQPTPGVFTNMTDVGVITLGGLLAAAFLAGTITEHFDVTDLPGLLTFEALVALVVVYLSVKVLGAANLEDLMREQFEGTKPEFIDELNENGRVALYSPHPVTLSDNPVSTDFNAGVARLSDFTTHFGLFHDKMQLVRREPDTEHPDAGDGFHYAAYVGGIDVNQNRVDTPGHHGKRNYHDVHARVTGPAAIDLFGFFDDRFARDAERPDRPADMPAKLFDPPAAIPPAGEHIVQAARTAYRPAPGLTGLPWAPQGDATIRETIGRAIESARRYIYIEDQYFTPDDRYVQLLREAADHCERLVIVYPTESDQPVGDDRRGAVVTRLAGSPSEPGGWGDRMYVGTPMRRPALLATTHASSTGRCFLVEDVLDAAADKIHVGPITRVPKTAPYFVWVGGELMAVEVATPVTAPSGGPAMELGVVRGGLGTQPRWYDHPRAHGKGEPVTVAKQRGIFVHSKTMIVDDVFVGIGSANVDRRGYFHDGEINAFAIPERLRGASDNPALNLRTRLWAEHLGLPPAMGPALLADPLAAFELFERSRYAGNRLARFRELRVPFAGVAAVTELLSGDLNVLGLGVVNVVQTVLEGHREGVWNTITDPTSTAEPAPQLPGPGLPPLA
jgi:phosphatidylserine/phosphatidylglycerophosphate/cardiolipin synthase-like enzyme